VIRVRFDDQIVMHQSRGGVSRYFVELAREFRADPGIGVAIELDWSLSRNEHALAAGLGRPASRNRRRLNRLSRRLPRVPRRIDVVHPTWYYPDRLPAIGGPPMAVTIVDMIPELLPDLFARGGKHLAKEAYARRAAAILCISESTRRDLLELYGPLDAVIEVVHLAVGSGFSPGRTSALELPADYVLFVGSRGAYKDFVVAADAFAAIRDEQPGVELVVAGGGRFTRDELANLRRLSIDGSVRQVEPTDADLPALFGGALAFVFPSRYEGFGLPTLEAMACGTPVILADSSSHPEVGGDAAQYFAPGDAVALGAQLLRVLGDTELRRTMAARGLERSAGFTWHRTAEATRNVYAKLLPRP
jgi:glycosyltransferase involved in cell wall biosynthesis